MERVGETMLKTSLGKIKVPKRKSGIEPTQGLRPPHHKKAHSLYKKAHVWCKSSKFYNNNGFF